MKKTVCILLSILLCITALIPTFATENPDYKTGDVDLNGTINVMDVTTIQKYIAKSKTLSSQQLSVADVNADSEINILDATLVQRYIAHIITQFPDKPEKITKVDGVTTTDVTPSHIDVQWNEIEGAVKYWVYTNSRLYTSTEHTQVTINTLENTTYEIKVTAQLADSTVLSLEDADAIIVTTPKATTPKVQNVKAEVTSHSTALVTWDTLDNAVKYWVYVNGSLSKSTEETSATVRLDGATTYEIKVTAQLADSSVLSLDDADAVTVIPEETEVKKVENVSAYALSPTQIEISWDILDNAVKYWVYANEKLYINTTDTKTTIKTLEDTTYEIKVIAQLDDSTVLSLDDADAVIVTTPKSEVLKVKNVKAESTSQNTAFVTWDALDGAEKYWVYVNSLLSVSTEETSATVRLVGSTTYEIRVIAQLSDSTVLKKEDADVITITPLDTPTQQPTEIPQDLKEYSKMIQDAQTDSTLTLSVISDMHYDETDLFNTSIKQKNIENLGEITKTTNIDIVANLGDNIIGDVDKETSLSSLNALFDIISNQISSPVLHVRGNHDDNGWYSLEGNGGSFMPDEMINDTQWQEIIENTLPQGFVKDEKKPDGGYGYIDHEDSKIRIFILNSCDIPYILNEDGSYRYTSYEGHAFSNEQLNFVAQSLLFEDKEDPNEWAALFLTHVPLDSSNLDNERFGGMSALIRGYDYMLSIISAYRKGTSFTMSGSVYNANLSKDRKEDFLVDVDIDYSKKGYGEVIAFFSGHTHSNNYTNKAGIENSLSYGYTFIGTIGSEAFTSYVINRDQKTISAFTYGPVYVEKTQGNIVGTPHTGSIASGKWSVTYDQFLPDGKNIFNGFSALHPLYYSFGDTTTNADLELMEVVGTTKYSSPRQLTKLIPVKPYTTYILPKDFSGDCLSYVKSGRKSTFLTINDAGDYKTLTTRYQSAYVAFSIDTAAYTDYKNFFIKETQYGIEY